MQLASTVPTVLDRFIQQVVMQALQRSWEKTFSEHSYGSRPKRSAHQAVEKAQQYQAEGYRWVVDLDLEKFFDRVNHDRLLASETPSVLEELGKWLRRRLRSMVWKQWKRGTTRYRELRKRGIDAQDAAKTAGSSDGPWHLANTPALNIALSNAYFASLGLPELTVHG